MWLPASSSAVGEKTAGEAAIQGEIPKMAARDDHTLEGERKATNGPSEKNNSSQALDEANTSEVTS
jgi:hypothetical protein